MSTPTEKKGQKVSYAKGVDIEKRTVTSYVSTFDWDRTDEKFAKGAWRLDNFKRNPVVMAFHDYTKPPVGKAVEIGEDDIGLRAVTQFADTDEAKNIFKLFEGGFLSAFSVGFTPRKWDIVPIDAERKGLIYNDAELLEYSVVGIPANPGALIGREIGEIAQKMLPKTVVKVQVGEEEKYLVLPDLAGASPEAQSFEESLKSIVAIAKDARRNRLPGNQISLLKSAHALFNEIIAEQDEGVDQAVIDSLRDSLKSVSEVILAQYSDERLKSRIKQVVKEIAKL